MPKTQTQLLLFCIINVNVTNSSLFCRHIIKKYHVFIGFCWLFNRSWCVSLDIRGALFNFNGKRYSKITVKTVIHFREPKLFSDAHWESVLVAIQEYLVNNTESHTNCIQLCIDRVRFTAVNGLRLKLIRINDVLSNQMQKDPSFPCVPIQHWESVRLYETLCY